LGERVFDLPYDVLRVPVLGGSLTVGRWGRGPKVVVAAHGVTATHASFHALADALGPEFTLLAPDLRGRAGSRDVGPPFGMAAHADDVAVVVRSLITRPVVLLGHSMGGFVAVVAAARHPELVASVVLVDGGLPLDLGPLAALPIDDLLKAVLGPSVERLSMSFPSVDAYLDFWRAHPALADSWNPYVERYLEADLYDDNGVLRPSAREAAVVADVESELREGVVEDALRSQRQPVVHLRAPRGIMNQVPPLYPDESLDRWREAIPQLRTELVEDCNHFTILLTESGARQVAETVRQVSADGSAG
jgi:pimeloyl-ACP methyl ester carboxylesterase